MFSLPSACYRCRSLLFGRSKPEEWFVLSSVTRRHRSGVAGKKALTKKRSLVFGSQERRTIGPRDLGEDAASRRPPPRPRFRKMQTAPTQEMDIAPETVSDYFTKNVQGWASQRMVRNRFASFGIADAQLHLLLREFVRSARTHKFSEPEMMRKYDLARFANRPRNLDQDTHVDRIYSNIFFTWLADSEVQKLLGSRILPSTISLVQRLSEALDSRYPEDRYTLARAMRRKVIMHVGPTNSGKTHNALRALAAARTGVYAGPLRLLAQEIWERLNLGQIIPLGVEEPNPLLEAEPAPSSSSSPDEMPAAPRKGNPAYARACNLHTGEEQKIVDDYADLTSSTVEMLPYHKTFDVAVVDEIQMIGDEFRGGGWTNAVLGLAAKELHLCGEETAVPIVQAMLQDTGDEVIIKRYQRLAPLKVEPRSLRGNLSEIQSGDCVITFSRKNVFALKKRIEETTGMRCAVVYGKLPPEIRNRQAELFNDPNSGYDVMVGSDAIGMGLNLRIKRIVFETVVKFDGVSERYLSLSQTKQIAGRAGRFGLHKDSDNVGLVTALREEHMPFLRRAVAAPFEPLKFAYLNQTTEAFRKVSLVLPQDATAEAISSTPHYLARLQPVYRYVEVPTLGVMSKFIDASDSSMTAAEKLAMMMSPLPWRDLDSMDLIADLMVMNQESALVDFKRVIQGSKYAASLEGAEAMMSAGNPLPTKLGQIVEHLEALHKILGFYMWMSLRNPVAWFGHTHVSELKDRVEIALDWCLQSISVDSGDATWDPERLQRSKSKIFYETGMDVRSRKTVAKIYA